MAEYEKSPAEMSGMRLLSQTVWKVYKDAKKRGNFMERINLRRIPKEERTYSLCLEAVSQNKMNVQFVPEKYKTEELFEKIKRYNAVLKYTPHKFKTYEKCIDAIKRGSYDLQYVPKKHKTLELCLTALLHVGSICFRYIPKRIKTKDFYKLALQENGFLIKYIPEDLLTKDLCRIAIRKDKSNLEYIPKNIIEKYNLLSENESPLD